MPPCSATSPRCRAGRARLGERLDALIARNVPNVRKAVRWNSPFYGIEGQGWFLSFHVFTRYVKVTFFCGTSLRPVPPGGTPKSKDARWIDIHEGDELDERADGELGEAGRRAARLGVRRHVGRSGPAGARPPHTRRRRAGPRRPQDPRPLTPQCQRPSTTAKIRNCTTW